MLGPAGIHTASVGKIHVNPWFGKAPPVALEESSAHWKEHREMEEWSGATATRNLWSSGAVFCPPARHADA
jgi:hypothetical protein